MTSIRIVSLLAIAFLAVACGRNDRVGDDGDYPELEAIETLRIGSVDDPETALTWIVGVRVASDGRIYSLHPQEQQVRVHASDGTPIGRIGRDGEGPGEFRSPYSFGMLGDTLWVLDFNAYRLSYFDLDGTLLRILSPPVEYGGQGRNPPRPSGLLADGTLRASPPALDYLIATGAMTEQPVMRMDTAGRVLDTLFTRDVRNSAFLVEGGGAQTFGMVGHQPFLDNQLIILDRSGRGLVTVDRAALPQPEPRFTVTRLGESGDTVFSRAFPYTPLPIPDSEVDSVANAFVESVVESFGASVRRAAEEQTRAKLYRPAHRPPVQSTHVGSDGSIWLNLASKSDSASTWLVLHEDGNPVGTVSLPSGLRINEARSGTIWGTVNDELDVPYIVRYSVSIPERE